MSGPRSGGGGGRRRKILWSVFGTVVGTIAAVVLVVEVRRSRTTDLADPLKGVTASELTSGALGMPSFRFRDVAQEMGIVMRHGPGARCRTLPEDTGSGLAWGDFDGDGDFDLYAVNFAVGDGADGGACNRLFRNDGARFTDVTEAAGVGDEDGFGMGASWADYDADGRLDLYVTNHGPNRLFRNRGDGTFEEVAERAGVADPAWSTGACWGDFDQDGDLDLYVCNYVRYDPALDGTSLQMNTYGDLYTVPFTLNPNSFDPERNRLYRNDGEGTFTDVAEAMGVTDPEGRSLAATFCDLDGDGWLDLYVNNDVSPNQLFRNRHGDPGAPPSPPFADISAMTGTADPRASMGLSVAEVGWMTGNADGLPDLFLTHWVAQENALYVSLVMPDGALEYRDKTRHFGLGEISLDTVGWGSAFVDLDLDGRVDLAVANGSTLEVKSDPGRLLAEPLFLFWNEGKRFARVPESAGEALAARHCARGLAAADFDGDGDVDLAISVNRGAPLLLRNETAAGHASLTVRLDAPPAACFGARVDVVAGGVRQTRWLGADVSFLSMHAPELVFGLGTATHAESVEVRFVGGATARREDVPAGKVVIARDRAR